MPPKENPMPPKENPGHISAVNAVDDDIIPLLLAVHKLVPNYKAMSALDQGGRTQSSFEHKFRKWRARARELLLARDGTTGEATLNPEPNVKKRAKESAVGEPEDGSPKKKAKASRKPSVKEAKKAQEDTSVKEEAEEEDTSNHGE